jgi:hypothetical protein
MTHKTQGWVEMKGRREVSKKRERRYIRGLFVFKRVTKIQVNIET